MTKMGKVGLAFNYVALGICLVALLFGSLTLTYVGLFWLVPAAGLMFIDERRRRKAWSEQWTRMANGDYP